MDETDDAHVPPPFHRRFDPTNGRFLSRRTTLEMRSPPADAPRAPPPGVALRPWQAPALEEYLALFRRVGTPWLWYGRLQWPNHRIADYLAAQTTEILRLWVDAEVIGFIELDRSEPGSVEIAYCGLAPGNTGRGLGRLLLRGGLEHAWQSHVRRVWLHTCTEDHPRALDVYQRAGFEVCDVCEEWIDDPRLRGLLPRDAGPHVPLPE
ncbi:GNAT family N-acetyltransferase [Arhodomonas sp. SL1]|uniref:GNAT family N-acetyltransferase n=1 Tax=Arhodomonas sp. SL1 TaxID=3425691 RepID=UPI003F8831F8